MAKQKVRRNYTEEQKLQHAAKFGGERNIREIIITDEEDGLQTAYLVRKPSRSVVQAITAAGQKQDANKATKLLIGCVLEGDMELIEHDGSVFVELAQRISELMQTTKSEIKKL